MFAKYCSKDTFVYNDTLCQTQADIFRIKFVAATLMCKNVESQGNVVIVMSLSRHVYGGSSMRMQAQYAGEFLAC